MTHRSLIAACLVTVLAAAAVASEGVTEPIVVAVSAASPVTELDLEEVRRIFLKERLRWPDGEVITVFERHSSSPIRHRFSVEVLGRTPAELSQYWLNLRLTQGVKAPRTCRSAVLVKEYLKRTRGGISYLLASEVDASVKVVAVVEAEDDG